MSVRHGAGPVPTVSIVQPQDLAGAVLAGASVFGGIVLTPWAELASGAPAMLAGGSALAMAVSWPRAKAWVPWAAAGAAAASLVATAHVLTADRGGTGSSGLIGLVEVGGLLVLVALVVRWAPARTILVLGAVTATAVTVWILRYLPAYGPLDIVGGCASMAVAAGVAVGVGGYPRAAAARLDWSVRSARQAQRLEIAHDLHDYVAHDLTGIVAQAQAAQYAFGDDPVRLAGALARIETVGLQALSAMDGMVAVLADDRPTATTSPRPALGDLPDLVNRFSTERGASCRVDFAQDPRAADPAATSPRVQGAAHRVVVEALTNVRRHAPAATRVAVTAHVRDADEQLVVTVTNDVRSAGTPLPRTSRGTGLRNLRTRVQALGGDLTAGPDRDGGWVLQAHMPTHLEGDHA